MELSSNAQTLWLKLQDDRPLDKTLWEYMQERRLLLLYNFEHLTEAATQVGALLEDVCL